jgi:hypothetical protein
MRNCTASILGAAVLSVATQMPALGAGPQAPPTLTPLVAHFIAAACPGTSVYVDALVRGATGEEAAASARLFDACAAAAHRARGYYPFRETVANVGVGAAYLAHGLLNHDPATLQHAIDATARLRSDLPATDDTIRHWPIIPDEYDVLRHEVVIRTDCEGGVGANAAYINVAARQGSAWVTTPREAEPCTAQRRVSFGYSGPAAGFPASTGPYSSSFSRPEAAGEPATLPVKEPPR